MKKVFIMLRKFVVVLVTTNQAIRAFVTFVLTLTAIATALHAAPGTRLPTLVRAVAKTLPMATP